VTEIVGETGQRPPGGLRVELLRFVALAILIGNLVLGADHGASIRSADNRYALGYPTSR
jgi:hypothetical protein